MFGTDLQSSGPFSLLFLAFPRKKTSDRNLIPRVLSYPPYGGRVGENPGNEIADNPVSH